MRGFKWGYIGLVVAALVSMNSQAAYQAEYQTSLKKYHQLLVDHVNQGRVNYAGLKTSESQLSEYLHAIAAQDLASLTQTEKKALYINAYNAFTLQLILDYWPDIESIKDIPDSLFSGYKRWEAKRWSLGGETVSLQHLEHELLRPMGDARIHFAIVCASISCPDLVAYAYDEQKLDAQLNTVSAEFLADPSKGLSYREGDSDIQISKIFSWFDGDFEKNEGTVLKFITKYANQPASDFLRNNQDSIDIDYLDYDWNLNN